MNSSINTRIPKQTPLPNRRKKCGRACFNHSPSITISLTVKNRVGAIRVVDRKDGSPKRISPLFIMPAYRNRGYAQAAIMKAEELHGSSNWFLDTIFQEEGNCHLYEKMGYQQTGSKKVINENMTLVDYRKD